MGGFQPSTRQGLLGLWILDYGLWALTLSGKWLEAAINQSLLASVSTVLIRLVINAVTF